MRLQISKKILIYILLLILFTTLHNKKIRTSEFLQIKKIEITGLSEKENKKILKNLNFLYSTNLLFVPKIKVENLLRSNNLIEKYSIFKRYPSTLRINLEKTNFLARIKKDGISFYVGSNGKLIKSSGEILNLPFIFGKVDIKEFLQLRLIIENSELDYNEIKDLYYFPSKRWDIKMNNGILVRLPKEKIKDSLKLLISIFNNKNFKSFKVIDLRQEKQVIIDE